MMNSITLTRREMLQCSVAAALTLPASGAGAGQSSPVTATGVVRADGAGLGGVLVTNGRDIVSTDEDGRYAISCNGDAIISVIKPTGYAVPLDPETNLARFYRIHQPLGTPPELDLSGPGIAPTGPLPESLDPT